MNLRPIHWYRDSEGKLQVEIDVVLLLCAWVIGVALVTLWRHYT